LEQYLQRQEERFTAIADSLDRIAASLAHGPAMAQSQQETFATLREHLAAQRKQNEQIAAALSDWPQALRAQRDSLEAVQQETARSREATDKMSNALSAFHRTTLAWNEATNASAAALRELHHQAAARDERLMTLWERQGRRLSFLAWSALAAAVLATAMAVWFAGFPGN
jgi:alanyl-tRNA synthetase